MYLQQLIDHNTLIQMSQNHNLKASNILYITAHNICQQLSVRALGSLLGLINTIWRISVEIWCPKDLDYSSSGMQCPARGFNAWHSTLPHKEYVTPLAANHLAYLESCFCSSLLQPKPANIVLAIPATGHEETPRTIERRAV